MEARERMAKARAQLLLDKKYVFWATVGLYQKPQEIPDDSPMWGGRTPTMATDGDNLYYSAKFVEKLSNQELMFVLAHEAAHCALGHHLRRGFRDMVRWNIAADYAINLILTEPPCNLKMVEGGLLDKKYKGMFSEEIYNQLKMTKLKLPEGWDVGRVMDAKGCGDGKEPDEATKKKWDIIVRQAAQVAKSQGYLPGQFEGLLEPAHSKVDLQSMLRHMFATVQEDDYTWQRPNRRYVFRDLYLPSQKTESTGDVLIGVDVSGSVDDEQLTKFLGVVNQVASELKPRKMYLVQCDAAIQKVDEFEKGEPLPDKVKIKGRGGTDMRPIWQWVRDNQIDIQAAIVCSDFMMDNDSFGKKQPFHVLWVTCTKDIKAPWGVTAKVDD